MAQLSALVAEVLGVQLLRAINIPPGIPVAEFPQSGHFPIEVLKFLMDNRGLNTTVNVSCCCPHFEVLCAGAQLLGITKEMIIERVASFCGENGHPVKDIGPLCGRDGTEYTANTFCQRLHEALSIAALAVKALDQPADDRKICEVTSAELQKAAGDRILRELGQELIDSWQQGHPDQKLEDLTQSLDGAKTFIGAGLIAETDFIQSEPAAANGCSRSPRDHFIGSVS